MTDLLWLTQFVGFEFVDCKRATLESNAYKPAALKSNAITNGSLGYKIKKNAKGSMYILKRNIFI